MQSGNFNNEAGKGGWGGKSVSSDFWVFLKDTTFIQVWARKR